MNEKALGRRDFLKLGLAGLASTAIGSRFMRKKAASGPKGESPHSWAMVIDQSKCVGCGYCTLACQASNDAPPEITWNRIIEVDDEAEEPVYLPMPCMHCEDAPCADICPVGATYQRPDGIVMMDYDRCIGCRYCEIACPYGARYFNWRAFTEDNPAVPEWGMPEIPRRPRGVVEKCSFCFNRIDRGLAEGLEPGVDEAATPACVVACPVGARLFGDLNDPDSPVSKALAEHRPARLRENLGTEPRVYYIMSGEQDEERLQEVCT